MSSARIFTETETLDILGEYPTTTIKATSLKAGMVLVDDLDLPAAALDHRMPATRGAGQVAWLAENLDEGGWYRQTFHQNADVKVVAK